VVRVGEGAFIRAWRVCVSVIAKNAGGRGEGAGSSRFPAKKNM